MTSPRILMDVDGGVATLTINRPEARNSLLRGMGAEIYALLEQVARNNAVKVLVFRGAGKDFCAGADMKSKVTAGENPPPDFDAYQVAALLHDMPQVTVAAVRGACAGAGFGYACACDLRVGDDDVRMNTAFIDVGVAGDMGVPWTLPRLIGSGRARDLMFLPRKIGSQEAQDLGLLQHVWSADAFESELTRLATRLAASAPLALPAMKANFVEAERVDFRAFLSIEAERHIRLLRSEDRVEAFKAWIEKRPPNFKGR